MKVFLPMAGTGDRFIRAGYVDPKPLIKVAGKRIIEYVLEAFSEDDEIVFICNEQHIQNTNMSTVLKNLRPDAEINTIACHKKGPVYTVLPFIDQLDDNEEVIICYCDNAFTWDKQDFLREVRSSKMDGCIITHSGFHPHTLNNTKMAFLKTDGEKVLEIKEKECYTEEPMNEHASTGAYYFRKGSFVKEFFPQMIDRNINYNGEYYVTLVYNLLIEQGLNVGYYDTEFSLVFGTPEEVKNYEAWLQIMTGGQVTNSHEAAKCFEYWKKYYDSFC